MYKPLYEGTIVDGKVVPGIPKRVFQLRNPHEEDQDIFDLLIHGVTFADNVVINHLLYEYYERWYAIYPEFDKMVNELVMKINSNGDYWERIYQSMLLEFNPLHNYDMTETEEDTRCGESEGNSSTAQNSRGTVNGSQFGYNETSPTATDRNDSTSKTDSVSNMHDRSRQQGKRTLTRQGNIGVTTSAQLIAGYRDIQLKILDMYIKSFSDLFMIL